MAKTPHIDTARIERTMRVVEYEDDKPKIKRFLEQRLEDPDAEPEVPPIGTYLLRHISRNTRIQNFYSAGTPQESELFSVPLITTVSGLDGWKGSKVKASYLPTYRM